MSPKLWPHLPRKNKSTFSLFLEANAPLGPASSEGLYVCMYVTLLHTQSLTTTNTNSNQFKLAF